MQRYQILGKDIRNCMIHAAKSAVKGKCGYFRSPTSLQANIQLHFWKSVKSCVFNVQQLPEITIQQSIDLEVDLDIASHISEWHLLKQIKSAKDQLWECQRKVAKNRVDWLKQNAQNVARAKGEENWEKRMNAIAQITPEMKLNRKFNNHHQRPTVRTYHY